MISEEICIITKVELRALLRAEWEKGASHNCYDGRSTLTFYGIPGSNIRKLIDRYEQATGKSATESID